MSRSSPWPTSWRGSPGRCCSAGNRLTPTRYPWPRRDSFGRSESAGRASEVCERVTTRWPDSQTALRKPDVENGARRRRVYEDRGARISILAGRRPPRPDTLKQTDQPSISTKPLADGAGHTFSTQYVDSSRRLRANSGHVWTALRTDRFVLELAFVDSRRVATRRIIVKARVIPHRR